MGNFRIDIQEEQGTDLTIQLNGTAGENLTAGDLCYLNTDGKYWKANANNLSKCSTEIRIVKTDLLEDEEGNFFSQGPVISSGLTIGVRYYISTLSGQITTVKPVYPNIARYIGTASSETQLEFNPLDINYDDYLQTQINNIETDKNFEFTQSVASASWSINHNLGKRPSVTIIDTGGNQVIGDIIYVDNNNITLNFSAAFSGTATLN